MSEAIYCRIKIHKDDDYEIDDVGKMRFRTYVSMCRLNSNTIYKDEFVLVALLMTLCKDKRIDSVVYSTKIRQICWKSFITIPSLNLM